MSIFFNIYRSFYPATPTHVEPPPAAPIEQDPEEQEWARKLGNRDFLLEENEEGYLGYIRDENEVYQFRILISEPPDAFSGALRYISEDKKFTEKGKKSVPGWARDVLSGIKDTRYRHFSNTCPHIYEIKIDFNLSRRQLKPFVLEERNWFLMSLCDDGINPQRYQKLREVFAEVQKTDQPLLNRLFKEFGILPYRRRRCWGFYFNSTLTSNWNVGSLILPYITFEERAVANFAMQYAVIMNDPNLAEKCLRLHPDLIQDDSFLFYAMSEGSIDTVFTLIESGMKVNHENVSPFLVLIGFLKRLAEPLKPEEDARLSQLVQLLLNKGALIDNQIDTSVSGETSLSVVEDSYFYRGNNICLVQRMCKILLSRGAKITPRMSADMKLQMKETKDQEFLPFLKEQGLITDEEVKILCAEKTATRDGIELAGEAITSNLFLEKELLRCHLNLQLIPIETIAKTRRLKKEIKLYLESHTETSLQPHYEKLKDHYRRLAQHHFLLRELRSLRREQPTSTRLARFYSLFGPENTYDIRRAQERIMVLFSPAGKGYWNTMVERVFGAAKELESNPFFKNHFLVWVHGTKSSILSTLLKVERLEALGVILEKGYVPFSGEICGSETGCNREHISGEKLCTHWLEEGLNFYFDASTRFLITLLYALKKTGYRSNEKEFDPKIAWERVSVTFLEKLVQLQDSGNAWSVVHVDILRLRLTDPEADQKLLGFKQAVEAKRSSTPNPELREKLEGLRVALTRPLAFSLSAEDLKYVRNPFPIVFGSTTVESTPFRSSYYPLEFQVKGSPKLGDDIQVAFTLQEKVKELQQVLQRFQMQVFPFDTAMYLEFMQMARGSLHKEWEKVGTHHHIAMTLQHDILPAYATPFPENPGSSFYGHGIPSYAEYRKRVEEGRILPRSIHGPMHATRTAIWTQLLASLYDYQERYLIGVAGAAHDWRREDEGIDRWDLASAQALRGYLLARGYLAHEIDPFVHAIAEKDPKEKCTTPEQIIIHNADVLDIKRCVRDFRKSELVGPPIPDEIIAEVGLFIQITENPELKAHLEHHSEDCFGDLLRIMKAVHDQRRCFPHLMKHLAETMSPFVDKPLDDSILKLCQ